MRLRRVRTADGIEHQVLRDGGWTPDGGIAATALGGRVFDGEWERRTADRHLPALPMQPALLPFQPLSFRDFMLYEQHSVDAARGWARRFLPAAALVGAGYERVTHRTFPAFQPPRLLSAQPVFYMGNAVTFVPSGTPVAAPSYSKALDYELELGFVLARPLLDATPDEAVAAIGAFVLVNDFSARDVQRAEMRSGFGLQKAKTFLSSMSETAVTADEVLPRVHRLAGEVRLNDRTVATVSSAGSRWSLGEVLAHASRSERLLPASCSRPAPCPAAARWRTGRGRSRATRSR